MDILNGDISMPKRNTADYEGKHNERHHVKPEILLGHISSTLKYGQLFSTIDNREGNPYSHSKVSHSLFPFPIFAI
jgi:hypothetical protein